MTEEEKKAYLDIAKGLFDIAAKAAFYNFNSKDLCDLFERQYNFSKDVYARMSKESE